MGTGLSPAEGSRWLWGRETVWLISVAEAASPGSSRCHPGYAGGAVGCEQFEMGPAAPR